MAEASAPRALSVPGPARSCLAKTTSSRIRPIAVAAGTATRAPMMPSSAPPISTVNTVATGCALTVYFVANGIRSLIGHDEAHSTPLPEAHARPRSVRAPLGGKGYPTALGNSRRSSHQLRVHLLRPPARGLVLRGHGDDPTKAVNERNSPLGRHRRNQPRRRNMRTTTMRRTTTTVPIPIYIEISPSFFAGGCRRPSPNTRITDMKQVPCVSQSLPTEL